MEQGIDDLDYFDPEQYSINGTRIVGGKDVNIRQVPWQCALYYYGYHICGCSIISADWVLTAAHCVEGGGRFHVRAGSPWVNRGGQIRRARYVVISKGYNTYTANHDISLIRVWRRFRFTQFVQPIALAKRGRRLPQRYFVSGWGTLREGGSSPNHLKGVTLHRVNRKKCRYRYRKDVYITKYMICAKGAGKDSCQGDSGGPLVRRGIQYGIVSFGIGCARPYYPGIYTNIRRVNKWIKKVIKRWGGRKATFK
ncbi:trypsin alpha-like [Haematobia irritans]|uniref:trypsin alpha-like n=1 Tax=Haematobia irritans TaxID=7368 RepID=UPI003F4F7D17